MSLGWRGDRTKRVWIFMKVLQIWAWRADRTGKPFLFERKRLVEIWTAKSFSLKKRIKNFSEGRSAFSTSITERWTACSIICFRKMYLWYCFSACSSSPVRWSLITNFYCRVAFARYLLSSAQKLSMQSPSGISTTICPTARCMAKLIS